MARLIEISFIDDETRERVLVTVRYGLTEWKEYVSRDSERYRVLLEISERARA
jgi:hypothetical protein